MDVQIKKYKPTDAHLKVFIYGVSGVGKTTFGITAPKPLYISAEGGLLSVAKHKPEYIEVQSMSDLNGAYDYLSEKDHGYQTVIIDSLTEIQNVVMTRIAGADKSPSREDWAVFSTEMAKILRKFRDLKMHVVFICLERKEEDKKKDLLYYSPDLFGQLASKAPAFMDFVGRLSWYRIKGKGDDKAKPQRGICFVDNEDFLAKDRSTMLPAFIEPNFKVILKAVADIDVGEEEVIDTVEGDDKIATQRSVQKEETNKSSRSRREVELPKQKEEEIDEPKDEDERPMATDEDMDMLISDIDLCASEDDLSAVKEKAKKFKFNEDQLKQLSEYGKVQRQHIKNGQQRIEVPVAPVTGIDYGASQDTIKAAEEVFGTSKTSDAKKVPPKKKAPPLKKKMSTLDKLQSAKRK